MSATLPEARQPPARKKASKFLVAMRRMLEDNHPSPAVSWSASGASFIIQNEELFLRLLPKYFKTKNFSSFVRQLNMYDFHKQKNEQGFQEFKQPFFRRDSPQLLVKISRKINEKHNATEKSTATGKDQNKKKAPGDNSSLNGILQELDQCKQENELKVQKLLVLLFLLGMRPELIEKVRLLFNDCDSNMMMGDDQTAFKTFIQKASSMLFKTEKGSSVDAILQENLGPAGFGGLFGPAPPAPAAEAREISVPQLKEESFRYMDGSRYDRSIKLQDDRSLQNSSFKKMNYSSMYMDFSDSHSLSDMSYKRKRREPESLVFTPTNERK